MKKTLVALAVTAFAASASAVTVYENEGTKVNFDGSVRVILAKESKKVGNQKSTDGHSNLKNAGSRFNLTFKHNVSEDFYALGHYETRFNSANKDTNASGWGDIATNQAYVGLGGQGHQVTFGKQYVMGDEIGQAGFDKTYNVGSSNIKSGSIEGYDILTSSSDSAVFYKFTGVKGLTLGANYNFANARNDAKEVAEDKEKSGFGLGAIYTFDIAEKQAFTVSAGYTHDDLVTGTNIEKDKDGIYFGAKYQIQDFTVAVDGGRGIVKTGNDKTKLNFVRAGARYDILPTAGVYGNYSYGTVKAGNYKDTAHQFMLGADYQLHKSVVTYVEGRIIKNKDNVTPAYKATDKAIGVGLRVFW